MKAILALIALAAALAVAGPAAGAEDRGIVGPSRGYESPPAEKYVPGVTDFPRSGPIRPASQVAASDGFDWLDAGFGGALGLALGASAAALLLVARRRAGLGATA